MTPEYLHEALCGVDGCDAGVQHLMIEATLLRLAARNWERRHGLKLEMTANASVWVSALARELSRALKAGTQDELVALGRALEGTP